MLISHEHDFIFVKTHKTAGTSIEMSVSPHMGKIDVVTPLVSTDSAKRAIQGDHARNFVLSSRFNAKSLTSTTEKTLRQLTGKKKHYTNIGMFYNHMPGVRIQQHVGPEIWEKYHTFCVERIPFDRAISLYHHRKSKKRMADITFAESIRSPDAAGHNYKLYCQDSKQIVDDIIPFHQLNNLLTLKMHNLGLKNFNGLTENAKSNFRADRRHWSEVINKTDREYISKTFEKEFNALKMTPEEAWLFELPA